MSAMSSTNEEKLRPENVPDWQRPYWDSVRAHAVAVQRCDDCATFRFAPRELCPRCHSAAATWTPIAGTGEVYTFTVVRRAPTPAYQAEVPYVIVHVQMREGFRMIATLRGVGDDAVRIGLPVRVSYTDVDDSWSLLEFVPA